MRCIEYILTKERELARTERCVSCECVRVMCDVSVSESCLCVRQCVRFMCVCVRVLFSAEDMR